MSEFRPFGPKNICDFCSAKDPTWTFPAEDFTDESCSLSQSVGGWAACEECAACINAHRWGELARRALVNPSVIVIIKERGEGIALKYIVRLHKQFRKHQRGGGHRTVGVQ